jgi:hypothetical protein
MADSVRWLKSGRKPTVIKGKLTAAPVWHVSITKAFSHQNAVNFRAFDNTESKAFKCLHMKW